MTTIATTALVLAIIACGGESAGEMSKAAVVDTVHVRVDDVPTVINAIGTVEANNQTVVSTEVRGQVARILHDEGAEVSSGTGVVQLDPGPYAYSAESAGADLIRAQAQLENDERLLERYDRLIEAGALDQQSYDDLQAKVATERALVEQARASVNTAQWNLSKATIRAPFTGTLGKRYVQLGEYLDSQQRVFDLVDAETLKVRFSLPETHAGSVQVGDAVGFRVRSDTVGMRRAQVNYVSPGIDAGTRTFEVTASYDNEDRAVLPGAYAEVSVTIALNQNAPIIPERAIYTEGQTNYVYVVVEDSKAEKRRVTIGSRFSGEVEVMSGLKAGEVVISDGQFGLSDGAEVRFVESSHPTLEKSE